MKPAPGVLPREGSGSVYALSTGTLAGKGERGKSDAFESLGNREHADTIVVRGGSRKDPP